MNQQVNLRGVHQQGVAVGHAFFEQLAVEAQHGRRQRSREATTVHVGPQHAQHVGQGEWLGLVGLQQAQKASHAVDFGQQLHVFGKHTEQAAGEKRGHLVRRVARGVRRRTGAFKRLGQLGQFVGHLARDAGADAGGVQAFGVQPDAAQLLAHLFQGQVGQRQAVAARVGKGCVGGTAAGEIGVQLNHVAHVHHQQKRRAALGNFVSGQGAGIAFGLGTGAQQGIVKTFGFGPCIAAGT